MSKRDTCNPRLGVGIYRIADVARYSRMPYSTARSWFQSRQLFEPDHASVSGVETVSFLDLIDTVVAAQFRRLGVRMRVVREACIRLRKELGTEHPFCHRNLYTDGRTIIREVADRLGHRRMEEVVSKQSLFTHIKGHLDNVSYSSVTLIAEKWNIEKGVVIDPSIALGRPVVRGTGVSTYVIRHAFYANGEDARFVAGLYGIRTAQVRDAVDFEDAIRRAA